MTFTIPLTSLKPVGDKIKAWLRASLSQSDADSMPAEVLRNALIDRLVGHYLVDNGFADFTMTGETIAKFQASKSLDVMTVLGTLLITEYESGDVKHKALEFESSLMKDDAILDCIEDYENNLVHLRRFQGTPRMTRYDDPMFLKVAVPVNLNGKKLKLSDLNASDVTEVVADMMAREAFQKNEFVVPMRIFGKTAARVLTVDIPNFVEDLVKEIKDDAAANFTTYMKQRTDAPNLDNIWAGIANGSLNALPGFDTPGGDDEIGLDGFE